MRGSICLVAIYLRDSSTTSTLYPRCAVATWVKRKMEVGVVVLSCSCVGWLKVVEVWFSFKICLGAFVFILMQIHKLG